LRIVVGTDLFLLLAVNGALLWILLPERAADAFRELAIGGDESSLDAAYSALTADAANQGFAAGPGASAPLSDYYA